MQYKSPAFSDFRYLMDLWDEAQEKDKIEAMLGANQLIFFFKKNGTMYGAPESSRLIFARMKNPDKDTPKTYLDDASFMAINLTKAAQGSEEKIVFDKADLKDIKIIDQDEVKKFLAKKAGNLKIDLEPEDEPTAPDAPVNINKIIEK